MLSILLLLTLLLVHGLKHEAVCGRNGLHVIGCIYVNDTRGIPVNNCDGMDKSIASE